MPAVPTATATSSKNIDTFLTESVIGMPFCIALGNKPQPNSKDGIKYSLDQGTQLSKDLEHDLSTRRPNKKLHRPVQQQYSDWRNFLSRNNHGLSYFFWLMTLLSVALNLVFAWQLGWFAHFDFKGIWP